MRITKKYVNDIAYRIVGCAIEVHKQIGPGLLESVYEICFVEELNSQRFEVKRQVAVPINYKGKDLGICFVEELNSQRFEVKRQVAVPINYKGKDLGTNLVLDLLINDLIIVELKAVELMIPVFKAQILSYLKLTGKPKGLLINFHCENIKDNLIPLVTDEFSKLPES